MDIKFHEKVTVSQYIQEKLEKIPKKSQIPRKKICNENVEIILDYEKYFSYAWSEGDQNFGFYTYNIANSSDNIRFVAKEIW